MCVCVRERGVVGESGRGERVYVYVQVPSGVRSMRFSGTECPDDCEPSDVVLEMEQSPVDSNTGSGPSL